MKRPVAWVQPGPVDTRTGGFIYNRRIMATMRLPVTVVELATSFPAPSQGDRRHAADLLSRQPNGTITVVDGLALGVLADEAAREAQRLRFVGLVHHPLALETGLTDDRRRDLIASETRALNSVHHVITTSQTTAHGLADYSVPSAKIDVVEPGTDSAPLAVPAKDGPCRLLSVATLTPRKGHAVLVHALSQLTDLDWTLDCWGSLERDPGYADEVRRSIKEDGLESRIALHGECDEAELAAAYANADTLVMPSFHEGYGMAVAEALARGLPIVASSAGALVDTVPADAGLLVPPGDAGALAAALRKVIADSSIRRRLAAGAAIARQSLPTWDEQGKRFEAILEKVGR
ncbi:MAG: glycosyltransferase family 4 protein [Pseudomonadota bacterium]